jgi:photosystem II stability/assembly factor-like uncharacterized protein
VFRTGDGGRSWQVVLADERPAAFFDAMAFAGDFGALFGDPLAGAFCVWTTRDAGRSWQPVAAADLPAPLAGEGAFAASGSCVHVQGPAESATIRIATGGGEVARMLVGTERGWSSHPVPLRAKAASRGGFGLAVRDAQLVVVGGDFEVMQRRDGTAAWSDDGGVTWTAASGGAGGYRSAAVWSSDRHLIAVGAGGTSVSADGGRSWAIAALEGFHALSLADGVVWACGEDGRVARLRLTERREP